MLRVVTPMLCGLLIWLLQPDAAAAQAAGHRYAVVISGLGGDPAYTERFSGYVRDTRAHLIDRLGFRAEDVVVLGEQGILDEPYADDESTAENIRNTFELLAAKVTSDDHVYVIFYGHGSFDGTNARVNIPRRDLDDIDYAILLDALGAGRIVVVNTTSASGPFAEVLSAPERIVITATATGTERDETVFPAYFIEALGSVEADLDKNGGLSVREAFTFAAQQTAQSFSDAGQLATEHPQMDDNGDGNPSRVDALDGGGDGYLASVTYFRPRVALASVSPAARPLLREKERIERTIADVKSRKDQMVEDAYYAELEQLFIELAHVNDRIESAP